MKRLGVYGLCIAIAGCAGGELATNSPDEAVQEPIIGGTLDTGDPAVVGLFGHQPGATSGALCTATLIAPTWLLTAAHCVDPSVAGDGNVYEAFFVNDMHGAPADARVTAKNVYWDTQFDENNLTNGHDVGLVELEKPAPGNIKPIPYIQSTIPSNLEGGDIRLVGFGLDNGFDQQGTSAGIKREVTVTLDTIGDKTLEVGQLGQTSCNGDSGGPALVNLNGVETLVGVTSYGMIFCLASGYYTRVDLYTDFINSHVGNTTCTPQCDGKQCGSDECGGSCGDCGPDAVCSDANVCEPKPTQGCPGETEGNEDPSQANLLCDGDSILGTLSSADDNDWFTFPVNSAVTYTILVENVGADVAVELYKMSTKTGNLMLVGNGQLAGDTLALSRHTKTGGKYFVHVYGAKGFSGPAQYGLYVIK